MLTTLTPGDEAPLERFLLDHADSSLFLRSNLRRGGLSDCGEPYQATYVGEVEDGRIAGVAAHCWNGVVLLQAPRSAAQVARAAVERSGRAVTGLIGPWTQLVEARAALEMTGRATRLDSRDTLFALSLADLVVPPLLAMEEVECRRPRDGELGLVEEWRVAFSLEALGERDGPALRAEVRETLARLHAAGDHWLLFDRGRAVSYTAFNARVPDTVQVGGVWTPPALRGRGYARCAVAGSLLAAREEGATRAVLFTAAANVAAQAAYRALGFRVVGDYGLVLFSE